MIITFARSSGVVMVCASRTVIGLLVAALSLTGCVTNETGGQVGGGLLGAVAGQQTVRAIGGGENAQLLGALVGANGLQRHELRHQAERWGIRKREAGAERSGGRRLGSGQHLRHRTARHQHQFVRFQERLENTLELRGVERRWGRERDAHVGDIAHQDGASQHRRQRANHVGQLRVGEIERVGAR
jgi:hypothetical protein